MMIMKQIEKAAEKYALECQKEEGYPSPMYDSCDAKDMRECAFKSGAEWQAKQSPWISIKDGLPEVNTIVLPKERMDILFVFFQLLVNGKLEQTSMKED